MNINLKGKNAIVCGSTQGIGKAIAVELAMLGANVTLFARNKDAMNKVIDELDASSGQNHGFISADFGNPEEVKNAIQARAKTIPALHILVNNSVPKEPSASFFWEKYINCSGAVETLLSTVVSTTLFSLVLVADVSLIDF